MHDLAHGAGAVSCFHSGSHFGQRIIGDDAIKYGTIGVAELAVKLFLDKTGAAAGNVDVFADQITVHLGDEVV